MKNTLIAVVVLLLAAAGVFFIMNNRDDEQPDTDNQTQTQDTTQPSQNETNNTPQTAQVTIVYTDNGFSPASYTAASGSLVAIKNESSQTLDFASDVHPTHEDNLELNVGEVDPGESTTFTVHETGTWSFHNHLFSGHTGTIKVE